MNYTVVILGAHPFPRLVLPPHVRGVQWFKGPVPTVKEHVPRKWVTEQMQDTEVGASIEQRQEMFSFELVDPKQRNAAWEVSDHLLRQCLYRDTIQALIDGNSRVEPPPLRDHVRDFAASRKVVTSGRVRAWLVVRFPPYTCQIHTKRT